GMLVLTGLALASPSPPRGRSSVPSVLWLLVYGDLLAFGWGYNPKIATSELANRPSSAVPLLGVPGVFRTTGFDRRVVAGLASDLMASNLGLLWGTEDVVVPSPLRMVRNERWLAACGLGFDLVGKDEQ